MPKRAEKEPITLEKRTGQGTPPTGQDLPGEAGNIDKIRDILFGNQVRDFDRRFAGIEARVDKAAADLRNDFSARMEALEHFFKEEFDTLKDRVRSETDKRSEGEKRLADELKQLAATATRSIQTAEDKFAERTTELRQQILEQSKRLSEEVQRKHDLATKEIASSASRLEESKVDRSSMAEYLMEVAMRLSDHPSSEESDSSNG